MVTRPLPAVNLMEEEEAGQIPNLPLLASTLLRVRTKTAVRDQTKRRRSVNTITTEENYNDNTNA